MGILANQVRWKVTEIPDTTLKGPSTASLTEGHTPWVPMERHGASCKSHMGNDCIRWLQNEGWTGSHHCALVGLPYRAVYRWVPACLH